MLDSSQKKGNDRPKGGSLSLCGTADHPRPTSASVTPSAESLTGPAPIFVHYVQGHDGALFIQFSGASSDPGRPDRYRRFKHSLSTGAIRTHLTIFGAQLSLHAVRGVSRTCGILIPRALRNPQGTAYGPGSMCRLLPPLLILEWRDMEYDLPVVPVGQPRITRPTAQPGLLGSFHSLAR